MSTISRKEHVHFHKLIITSDLSLLPWGQHLKAPLRELRAWHGVSRRRAWWTDEEASRQAGDPRPQAWTESSAWMHGGDGGSFVDYPHCPCSCLLGRQWARVKGLESVLCTRSDGVEVSLLPDVRLRPAREAAVASATKTRQPQHQKAASPYIRGNKLPSQPQGSLSLNGT